MAFQLAGLAAAASARFFSLLCGRIRSELQRINWKRSDFWCSSAVLNVIAVKSESFNLIFEIELLISATFFIKSWSHQVFLNFCAAFHIGRDLTILTVIS